MTINLPTLKPSFKSTFWSPTSFKSATIFHGTSHNICDNCRGSYELSSTRIIKPSVTWDTEAAVGHKGSNQSNDSLAGLKSSSREFVIQGGGEDEGVAVSTSYTVMSEDAGNGGIRDGCNMGSGRRLKLMFTLVQLGKEVMVSRLNSLEAGF